MPEFIPGLELNRKFFQQVVKPLLDEHFAGLEYAAGIIGEGSDVLGYDSPLSMDHNWGPHMRLILSEKDYRKRQSIHDMFAEKLPYDFLGFSTNFTKPSDGYLVQQMEPIKSGKVNHMIEIFTPRTFFGHYLGIDPEKELSWNDWLVFPQNALLEVTRGEVYYDRIGFDELRKKFTYYPEEVWLYLYFIQWDYIGAIEGAMGRTGEIGDELGSNRVATEIVTHIMKTCFLIEKQYWPYYKWFGTAFSRLKSAAELTHPLLQAVHGRTWAEREEALGRAYEILLTKHNELGITQPVRTSLRDFNGRPYMVIEDDIFDELEKKIAKTFARDLKYRIGAIDQFISHPRISHMNYVYHEFCPIVGATERRRKKK
jgi:hypothetical protein